MKYAGDLWQLCQSLVSSMEKSNEFSAKQVSVNHDCFCCMAAIGNPYFSSLFQVTYVSALLVGWGETEAILCVVPPKAGEAGCSPHCVLLFLATGSLSSWEIPLWDWTMAAWGMGWCRWNEVVFFLFCSSQGFLCCWNILRGFQISPSTVFLRI